MNRYDPLIEPAASEWLALNEMERIQLVEAYHKRKKISNPNALLHATFHCVAENQNALNDPPLVKETLTRLLEEGLDRHNAIHAIARVFSEQVYHAMKGTLPTHGSNLRYEHGLRQMTAKSFLRGGEE